MRANWVGAACAAGLVLWFGWGLAGLVATECDPHPRAGGCAIPDSGWKYFAGVVIAPWPLGVLAKFGAYRRDWRPALGYSAGAIAGAAVTLSMGTSTGHWIVVAVLLTVGALVPWCAWRHTDAAREARRLERSRRLRDERRERSRARRAERRCERRRRQQNTGV
ncbi:hypothetical protein AAHZ94_06515 [Streptomyces sp. HSW2009]|uniref:hypothetical protein n=1 Tax=Streptomyces sp. HSW2009 TaxID=3142890 RepID=UPI0032EE4C43